MHVCARSLDDAPRGQACGAWGSSRAAMVAALLQGAKAMTTRSKKSSKSRTPTKPTAQKAQGAREGSKQAQLIAMLRQAKGVTIDEIAQALSWQPHTVRGAMAGALKKKLGLDVISEKDEKRGRIYRITNRD